MSCQSMTRDDRAELQRHTVIPVRNFRRETLSTSSHQQAQNFRMSLYTINSMKTNGSRLNDSPLLGRHNTAASISKVNLIDNDIELAPLKFAALSARTQQVREIVQDGSVRDLKDFLLDKNNVKSINNLDEEGVALLHLAVRLNRVEVTRMLIDHGAEPDIRLKDGSTPLHVAAR